MGRRAASGHRKKSRKQKMKDLNQRSETTSDMDAFVDHQPQEAQSSSPEGATASSPEQVDVPSVEPPVEGQEEKGAEPPSREASVPKEQTSDTKLLSEVRKDSSSPVVEVEAASAPEDSKLPPVDSKQSPPDSKPASGNSKQTSPEPAAQEPEHTEPQQPEEIKKVEITVEDRVVTEKNERNISVETSQQNGDVDISEVEDTKQTSAAPSTENINNKLTSQSDENKENEAQNASEDTTTAVDSNEQTDPVIKKNTMELKYKYREDQWSPLNPEGKMHYDRNFLLQLQYAKESLEKPESLPKLPEVILDTPVHLRGEKHTPYKNVVDFTPGYIMQTPPRPPIGPRRSQQKRADMRGVDRGNEPRKVINISVGMEVKLHQTENAWKPVRKEGKDKEEASDESQEVFRKVRGILNKLTPQKFQTLIQQVMDLPINSEERIVGCIDIVFEKAISEPSFSVAYANMCKCMVNLKVPRTANPADLVTFRSLLLNRCQKEFEKDKADAADLEARQKEIDEAPTEEKKKELKLAMEEAETKARRRSLGNIRFIGELFKLRMLTEHIMHDCLVKLLRSNDEDSLECLCRLLTTIGKDIDHEKAKPRVDQYFNQMEKIVKNKKTSARVRFMLLDVIDLRKNAWVPRREDNNPKTIEQIHREAQQEKDDKQQMIANVKIEHKRPRGRGQSSSQGGPPNQMGDDGWQAVGKSANRNDLNPTRMKITKQPVDESIQLGPGGRPSFSSWGRGSSGGGRQSSSQEGEKSTPGNRFSALSQDNYDRGGGRGLRPGITPGRDNKGRLSQQRGKPGPRLSQEQERESALAAARNIGGGPPGSRTTPVGSRNQSRDRNQSNERNQSRERNLGSRESSRNREMPREKMPPPAAPTTPQPKELSTEEIDRRTKGLLDEYLHINDLKEAILCVKELESPKNIYYFVNCAVSHVLERSAKARQMTGDLLHDLVRQGILTTDSYSKGFVDLLEFAEDMEIDIPKFWVYIGELVGPMLQHGDIPLTFLKTLCKPLLCCNKAGVMVAEVLHNASHNLGHIKVGDMWRNSGLQWSDFLQPKENVQEFIKKHKLEFTLGQEEPRSPDGRSLPIFKVQQELDKLIIRKQADNEEVFDWIEANVGENKTKDPLFIRALMKSVCSSAITGEGSGCKVDPELIKKRCILLQKYLDHKAELELQALYALQALVQELQHPSGVLRTFFDTLYDEDIISEDAFNQWDASEDPAEQAGKGVARASVVQFFTWLHEAEEESQEDS